MAEELPAYSRDPPPGSSSAPPIVDDQLPRVRTRMLGDVHTLSIADMQHDYLKITRVSPTTFHLSLSIDPEPLYRVELSEDRTAVEDVVIYPMHHGVRGPPVASARMQKLIPANERAPALASLCAEGLYTPRARWHTFRKFIGYTKKVSGGEYAGPISIVPGPGLDELTPSFSWRIDAAAPHFELWWGGPLHLEPAGSNNNNGGRDPRYLFASVEVKKMPRQSYPTLIRFRRGGGLVFELTLVLQLFVITHHMNTMYT
jgi:hypothetical protein